MATPRIKFCGVNSRDDAERAAELGAWAVGMIFHRPSPRRCRREEAVAIAGALRRRIELVGVFVNAHLDELARTAEAVGLTALQLHGDEGPAYCAEAARRTGCRVIKAVRVRSAADVRALRAYHTEWHLLDGAGRAGVRGGSGATFDWALAGAARHTGAPIVLGGGLTPDNVGEAIAAVRPWAVDVASGVEAAPGRKDPAKLEAFAAAVAATDVEGPAPAAPEIAR